MIPYDLSTPQNSLSQRRTLQILLSALFRFSDHGQPTLDVHLYLLNICIRNIQIHQREYRVPKGCPHSPQHMSRSAHALRLGEFDRVIGNLASIVHQTPSVDDDEVVFVDLGAGGMKLQVIVYLLGRPIWERRLEGLGEDTRSGDWCTISYGREVGRAEDDA